MPQSPDCAVPNLTTAHTAPLLRFESLLLQRAADIEAWFRGQWRRTPPPFYGSVDLRNAGFKLAPVDTNLFPGGFNNLNPAFESLCVQAIQSAFERVMPSACGAVLVPENHTRNRFYLENVAVLQALIRKAGYKCELGSLRDDLQAPETLELESGRELILRPLQREGDQVRLDGRAPCVVLLNNDLSGGRPAILEDLAQPVIPPLGAGWSNRLKTQHFTHYDDVAVEFAGLLDIDPWWVNPLFRHCGKVDFTTGEGEDCLVSNVDELLDAIREKYAQYGVADEPFAVVKADAGTYGMGVMTVRSGEELRHLNRKARKKMSSGKEGRAIDGAMIQEGVPTYERWVDQPWPADPIEDWTDGHTAEPVVYMIDRFVVGGFYRVHDQRGNQENLNAPGARFKPLAFAQVGSHPDPGSAPDAHPNRFYAYGVVARLALLAAAREIADVHAREPAALRATEVAA